jgi:hypothetical protein
VGRPFSQTSNLELPTSNFIPALHGIPIAFLLGRILLHGGTPMPRHTKKTRTSDRKAGSAAARRHGESAAQRRDQANQRRFVDRSTEGDGIAAQDLPGAEHGQNVVDPPDEMQRNLPQQHGGELDSPDNYSEGGLRGDRRISGADLKGGRKRN